MCVCVGSQVHARKQAKASIHIEAWGGAAYVEGLVIT